MTVRIAVAGLGLICPRHVDAILVNRDTSLAAVVDSDTAVRAKANHYGVPYFACLADLFSARVADGVVLATPNLTPCCTCA
jgi:predicted dehydrogenase